MYTPSISEITQISNTSNDNSSKTAEKDADNKSSSSETNSNDRKSLISGVSKIEAINRQCNMQYRIRNQNGKYMITIVGSQNNFKLIVYIIC